MDYSSLAIDLETFERLTALRTDVHNVATVFWNKAMTESDSVARRPLTRNYLRWAKYRDTLDDALALYHPREN